MPSVWRTGTALFRGGGGELAGGGLVGSIGGQATLGHMGQPITVVEKPTSRPGVVRFELNRSMTGMAHEHYRSAADIVAERPVDELVRRLFARGGIDGVHVYSNEVTVDLAKGATAEGLREIIEGLYIYYLPGVQPSIIE